MLIYMSSSIFIFAFLFIELVLFYLTKTYNLLKILLLSQDREM